MAPKTAPVESTATVLAATAGQVRLQLEDGREVAKRVTVPISRREGLPGTTIPILVTGTGAKARVDLAENWLDASAPAKKAPAKRTRKPAAAKADAAGEASAEKPAARRRRTGGEEPAEAVAEETPAKKPATRRKRSGGEEPAAEAPKKPGRKPRAQKASPAEAPVAAAGDAEAVEAPKRSRTRGAKKTAEAEAPVEVAAPDAPVDADALAEAATPGEAPSIAEEPKAKRPRGRGRGRGRKADAATAESPAKADIPATPEAGPAPAAPAALEPEVLRDRIAAAVELVRAARAA